MTEASLLTYAHIGDLHLTSEDEDNYRDLAAIVDELTGDLKHAFDFVYVPGDNADNGLPEQYALVARQLDRLKVPVHIITGDHDMEPGSLDNFYRSLKAERLPKALDAGGVRCLYLDICGPGTGGPDFQIGAAQKQWLAAELERAAATGTRCAIFMHSYPADLKGDGEIDAVNRALKKREVLLVDMGHTHYNELANDGRTIFAATRSTGQIEEGPVGYTIVTIDDRTVSWRFRQLGDPLPIVLITAPSDRRLATEASHRPDGHCEVRASVLGSKTITRCLCSIDDGEPMVMQTAVRGRFSISVKLPRGANRISVEAEDRSGALGSETVELATEADLAANRHGDGSDADAIDAWPERGILGTQLGPNRNGREW